MINLGDPFRLGTQRWRACITSALVLSVSAMAFAGCGGTDQAGDQPVTNPDAASIDVQEPSAHGQAVVRVTACVERWNDWVRVSSPSEVTTELYKVVNLVNSGATRSAQVIGGRSYSEAYEGAEPDPRRPNCSVTLLLGNGAYGAFFGSDNSTPDFKMLSAEPVPLAAPNLGPDEGAIVLPINAEYGTLLLPSGTAALGVMTGSGAFSETATAEAQRAEQPATQTGEEAKEVDGGDAADPTPGCGDVAGQRYSGDCVAADGSCVTLEGGSAVGISISCPAGVGSAPAQATPGSANTSGTSDSNLGAPTDPTTQEKFVTPSGDIACIYAAASEGYSIGAFDCYVRSGRTLISIPATRTEQTVIQPGVAEPIRFKRVSGPILRNGETWGSDYFRCALRAGNLTCKDTTWGHGVVVSRAGVTAITPPVTAPAG